jgi:diguanylate cyclase (GGDEF)-like protein
MLAACVVYFGTNLVLVTGALAWTSTFWEFLLDDFPHYTATTFSVLALSPVIVAVAKTAWELLPLLLIPLVLVYKLAQMSVQQEHQASHDPLTGLPNRSRLQATLNAELARSKRDGRPFGLLLIDLDHFKEVNDTLGHHVGDQLLARFADRLRKAVRPSDHLARLGGDEFAVIVPDAGEAEVLKVADRIRAALVNPIELEGLWLEIEASIGLAMHPEHALLAEDLLRLSDVAMYVAKESRCGVAAYSAERDHNSADRLSLVGELRQALDDGALTLQYQPKVCLRDGSLLGVEALVRWQHPQRGFIPPDEFIPLAERSGLILPLTEHILDTALAACASWRRAGHPLSVAVNLSPQMLTDRALIVELVEQALARNGVPAECLTLEITESGLIADPTNGVDILHALRSLGVRLSVDDFGTGHSSLSRLTDLPVQEMKIDKSFVREITRHRGRQAVTLAAQQLGHALGLHVVAEGVETQAEFDHLRGIGCDSIQGYFVARPLAPDQFLPWLESWQESTTLATTA